MVSETLNLILQLLIYPGFLFIFCLAFFSEWIMRKFVARIQSRMGPTYTGYGGVLQPIADFIKLLGKEDIIPALADRPFFTFTPLLYLALPLTAIFILPMASQSALISFEGDLIFLEFIFTMLTMMVFLGGFLSGSIFSMVGGVRAAIQLLGYEIPFLIALFSPSIPASSLSISKISAWQAQNNAWGLWTQPIGFSVLVICLLAELELLPFDIPEAETEIVAGWNVEFTGRRLALIRLGKDVEVVLASAILADLYLGGPQQVWIIPPIIIFLAKMFACLLLLGYLKTLFARFRIDQVLSGMWKYVVPAAMIQLIILKLIW
ncbi:MAG TPA: NADH-quinone oxidoreductase subunit H [Nitrososphaeria archaeon]|nr:NADH-quinone oxidoreductase subunit H [Nitrososphaeria archaeon]